MTLVLAFDTAGSACSAVVGRGDLVLAAAHQAMRHGHAEALLPMIDRVMIAAGCSPQELDAVAVSVGPGGFTGIRAGLAAAHGLALAAGAQLIGVTSFAAVAARAGDAGFPTLVALDSRRDDFYLQFFGADGEPVGEPQAVLPEALAAQVAVAAGDGPLRIAGDRAEAARVLLTHRERTEILPDSAPEARGVLAAALRWFGGGSATTPARPLYLRPPDVTMPKPGAKPRRTPGAPQ
jgi:tRNA threonylcarbamoyladenosine biosynthesis protein TsaB